MVNEAERDILRVIAERFEGLGFSIYIVPSPFNCFYIICPTSGHWVCGVSMKHGCVVVNEFTGVFCIHFKLELLTDNMNVVSARHYQHIISVDNACDIYIGIRIDVYFLKDKHYDTSVDYCDFDIESFIKMVQDKLYDIQKYERLFD